MPADLFTVREVATLLKLNPQTVRNWIDEGYLPATRIGRAVRIPRENLETLVGTTELSDGSFFTVAEVAAICRLNPQTIRNAIDDGRLSAVRVGRRVRIRRADLENYTVPVFQSTPSTS